jgi:hypothetical protein
MKLLSLNSGSDASSAASLEAWRPRSPKAQLASGLFLRFGQDWAKWFHEGSDNPGKTGT